MLLRDFIGELIAQGLSQSEIARKSGVRQPTVNRIYLGDSNASMETIAKIARAFGRHPGSFIEWEGPEDGNTSVSEESPGVGISSEEQQLLDVFRGSKTAKLAIRELLEMSEEQRLDWIIQQQDKIRKGD